MQTATRRAALTALVAAAIAGTGSQQSYAAPVTVQLRVEGSTSTIFEGPVRTDGHAIAKDATGSHPCDGTNGGANPTPGPTMTAALDDASLMGAFTWAGTWFSSFSDFTIDRVGPDAATSSQFWGYARNYQTTNVGGCQQQVGAGDDVLFAYDYFSKAHLLKLAAPATTDAGSPFTVTVTDGQDGSPAAAASVGGTATGPDGRATLTFDQPGQYTLKAERADSVRSNAAVVCVHRGNDGTCGTTAPSPAAPGGAPPTPAPVVLPRPDVEISRGRLFAPGHGPRLLRGTVTVGSDGLAAVRFRLTRRVRGRCQFYSAVVERLRATSCATGGERHFYTLGSSSRWSYLLPFRLPAGRYVLEVRALDRAARRAMIRVPFTVKERHR